MKPRLRAVVLVLAAAALLAPAAPAAEPALEGMYTAQGSNPDGSEYRGVVKIVRRGEGFMVAWLFPHLAGDEMLLVLKSAGVGLVSSGTLAVSYYGQDATGIALYQIESGGQRLVGRWASANGEGAVQTETLTKLPAPTAVPDTDVPTSPAPTEPIRATQSKSVLLVHSPYCRQARGSGFLAPPVNGRIRRTPDRSTRCLTPPLRTRG